VPNSLPRGAARDQQVDPAGILGFLDALDERPDIEMHSLMLLRHGQVVAEGWWHPYSADRVHRLYSLSKSFTSTAAAFAAAEGMLDLDDTVLSHFPELDAEITDPGSRSMKVRHIAAMASGHEQETIQQAQRLDPREPVRGFLLIPPQRPPGSVFAYNQPCTYTLGAIVQRHANMPLSSYLRPRLFDPLDIGEVGWQTLAGREQGYSGLHARTEDIAKLGQLYLQRGRWDGTLLLQDSWVAQATSRQIDNPNQTNPDWRCGYGFQFWMSRHGFRGDGAFGQFCVVLPERDAVVVTTASTLDMQAVLDAMWTHLLPAFDRPPSASYSQERLQTRLAGLRLPPVKAGAEPPDWVAWNGRRFNVRVAGAEPYPAIQSLEIERVRDGVVEVTLDEADDRIRFAVGTRGWSVSTPSNIEGKPVAVAASGGWSDQATLRVEVIFLETPHRLDVLCSLDGRCATIAWRLPPLGASRLREMCSPR
jgi:CubicO group peptidase (beta-lactamase class C family)